MALIEGTLGEYAARRATARRGSVSTLHSIVIDFINPDHISGFRSPTGAPSFMLDEMATFSDALLIDSKCCEEAAMYLEYLKASHSALFDIISDVMGELSTVATAQYLPDTFTPPGADTGSDDCGTPVDSTSQTPLVYQDGRAMHECQGCGKLHDRKGRVIACMNSHFGSKPYQCHGECGKRRW